MVSGPCRALRSQQLLPLSAFMRSFLSIRYPELSTFMTISHSSDVQVPCDGVLTGGVDLMVASCVSASRLSGKYPVLSRG
jgi:hypothetical protein